MQEGRKGQEDKAKNVKEETTLLRKHLESKLESKSLLNKTNVQLRHI